MNNIIRKIPKAVSILRERGLKGLVKKILEKIHAVPASQDVLEYYNFIVDDKRIPFSQKDYESHKNDDLIILNWIIPEMGKGSGGHLNIFRFISYLEKIGFHSRIYLYQTPNYNDNESVREFLRKYFPILDNRVEAFWDVRFAAFAHATVATSWQTAYFVRNFNNTISKFYFVQDYEPYFYARGSEYEFAKQTYSFGFRGITAGDWLRNKLMSEFGMRADSFSFSYDKEIYKPLKKKGNTKRVFFYARPVTPRRDFEIGLLALNILCKKMPDVEIVFAGWDVSNYSIPFTHKNLKILPLNRLSRLYAQCDLCLIISNTNLSLLPLEVMASNSVAVCSKGENSTWLVNKENAILVDYNPCEIAKTMEYYLKHENELQEIRQKGLEFARATSWENEAEKVKDILLRGIAEDEKK